MKHILIIQRNNKKKIYRVYQSDNQYVEFDVDQFKEEIDKFLDYNYFKKEYLNSK
jgi:hypothetical protein